MICKMSIKILKSEIQYNQGKVLIVFNDMITDMIFNIKLNSIVTKLRHETKNFICFYHAIIL